MDGAGTWAIAIAGVGILIYQAATRELPGLEQIALGIFLLAATGGAALFFGFHLRNKPLPIPLIAVHGATALVGYILLLMSMSRGA